MKLNRIQVLLSRVKAALFSGQHAAYLAMTMMAIGPFTRLLDRLLSLFIPHRPRTDQIPPCVLIIGGSRSGSTIINQVVTRAVDCVYISNIHVLFPRTGNAWMRRFKGYGKADLKRKNYYGYTASIYDVNEANDDLEKIFVGDPDKAELRARFSEFVNRIGAKRNNPFIFKNVRHSEKFLQLEEAVPELFFLKVDRDLHQISQSVLRAYHELGYFHPIPKALDNVALIDPVEFAAREVIEVERELNERLEQISPERVLRWSYESFCESPTYHLQELNAKALNGKGRISLRFLEKPLNASNNLKVTEDESEKLTIALDTFGSS